MLDCPRDTGHLEIGVAIMDYRQKFTIILIWGVSALNLLLICFGVFTYKRNYFYGDAQELYRNFIGYVCQYVDGYFYFEEGTWILLYSLMVGLVSCAFNILVGKYYNSILRAHIMPGLCFSMLNVTMCLIFIVFLIAVLDLYHADFWLNLIYIKKIYQF